MFRFSKRNLCLVWIFTFFILIVLIIAIEIYTFQAFKTISKSKIVRFSFLAISIAVYVYFFFVTFSYNRSEGQTPQFQMAMGMLLTVSIPKLVIILLLFGEDIYRLILKLISIFSMGEIKPLATRRKFISQLAIAIAAIPFASFIYESSEGTLTVIFTFLFSKGFNCIKVGEMFTHFANENFPFPAG